MTIQDSVGHPDQRVALAPRLIGLGPSPTIAIQERANALARAGRRVHRFGLGQSPFPVPRVVVDALRAHADRKDYLPTAGLPELREAVAEYHRRRQRIERSADAVLVGPGSKELMFLLQVAFDGEILIPTPAWVSYEPQARILGRLSTRLAHTGADRRLSPDALESMLEGEAWRPRVLILNYPNNPTGLTYAPDELAALAAVCRRHGIVVLSDEIYGELHFEGAHASIATHLPEATIVSSGLSKWCGAGGWRLGTFLFPRELAWLQEAMRVVASETFTSTSAPIQYAAVSAFQGGLPIERYLARVRKILHAVALEVVRRIREAGAAVAMPQGAFYVFPDFGPARRALAARGIRTSRELCSRLLEEAGVACLPGSAFGRPPDELTARLSLVDFDGSKALAALEAMPQGADVDAAFIELHAHAVLEGVESLLRWVAEGPAAAASTRG
ncbi:MAG: aminotransferase class I/II-fold pyridoxal phosphate-dependent enzyme [Planctomycetes bacterium]|nr:aminotransferase class I/II-fold pyridoxal phosphate-dependent enzyme [Planctomycetota bacterium]